MKRQEKMSQEQRNAYQTLLKEIENVGEEAEPTRQILQLALQLDEKGKMKYEYKGNVYNYVGVGKFKDSTGKWIDAIIYERDNHAYMREITDFIDKFKKA